MLSQVIKIFNPSDYQQKVILTNILCNFSHDIFINIFKLFFFNKNNYLISLSLTPYNEHRQTRKEGPSPNLNKK